MTWLRRLFRRGNPSPASEDAELEDAKKRVQRLEAHDEERELRLRRLGLEVEIKRREQSQ